MIQAILIIAVIQYFLYHRARMNANLIANHGKSKQATDAYKERRNLQIAACLIYFFALGFVGLIAGAFFAIEAHGLNLIIKDNERDNYDDKRPVTSEIRTVSIDVQKQ